MESTPMHESHALHPGSSPGAQTELDPVCGMKVHPATARGGSHEHAGTRYYFCNPRCRERFQANPEKYLSHSPPLSPPPHSHSPASPSPSPAAASLYTCPMHPEVRQSGPGSCPLCGMALEPETPSALDEPSPELLDMQRRFAWSAALT